MTLRPVPSLVSVSRLQIPFNAFHEVVKAGSHHTQPFGWLHFYHTIPKLLEVLEEANSKDTNELTCCHLCGQICKLILIIRHQYYPGGGGDCQHFSGMIMNAITMRWAHPIAGGHYVPYLAEIMCHSWQTLCAIADGHYVP